MTFVLEGGVGFCNAVRRTLTSDVENWAPFKVTVRRNTSCQTDEYIAHRIGLIPFRRVGNGTTMECVKHGPGEVECSDLTGPAFDAVYPNISIMKLGEGQTLDLTIHFDKRPARDHARYCMCSGVAIESVGGGKFKLNFEVLNGRSQKEVLLEALDHLDQRVDRALKCLAHQDTVNVTSYC